MKATQKVRLVKSLHLRIDPYILLGLKKC